jgi:hypothetical protein
MIPSPSTIVSFLIKVHQYSLCTTERIYTTALASDPGYLIYSLLQSTIVSWIFIAMIESVRLGAKGLVASWWFAGCAAVWVMGYGLAVPIWCWSLVSEVTDHVKKRGKQQLGLLRSSSVKAAGCVVGGYCVGLLGVLVLLRLDSIFGQYRLQTVQETTASGVDKTWFDKGVEIAVLLSGSVVYLEVCRALIDVLIFSNWFAHQPPIPETAAAHFLSGEDDQLVESFEYHPYIRPKSRRKPQSTGSIWASRIYITMGALLFVIHIFTVLQYLYPATSQLKSKAGGATASSVSLLLLESASMYLSILILVWATSTDMLMGSLQFIAMSVVSGPGAAICWWAAGREA